MIDVLGDIIPFGVGVALSPFPIIAVLLLLTAPVGVGGGLLFLAGRAVGFALLTAAVRGAQRSDRHRGGLDAAGGGAADRAGQPS